MRTIAEDAQRIGDEQRAEAVRVLIRIDDFHRPSRVPFADCVVGVGQSEGELPTPDGQSDLLVAAHDLGVVLQSQEELAGRFVTPGGEQYGRVRRRRPEQRSRNAHLVLPARIDQVVDRIGQFFVGNQFGIHDQHPRSRRQAMPGAVVRSVVGREVAGCFGAIGFKQPEFAEP